jgi:predicted nucleotide-binding protein (sugar kinase/HSP70/actin superfamily)
MHYSTYRYRRESQWRKDYVGLLKSRIQKVYQHTTNSRMEKRVSEYIMLHDYVDLKEVFERSAPYVHKDYDGDPIIALGSASSLVEKGISGVIYILPFTCMPGTIVSSVTSDFRKDHRDIPWLNFAYDGQQDSGTETRLQAFMHQAENYRRSVAVDKLNVSV